MFNLKQNKPKDIKVLRSDILDFIKDQLKKAESGEGENIKGLYLYITCQPQDKFLYAGALHISNAGKFKEEVQKIADDYAIKFPLNWTLHLFFDEPVPPEAIQSNEVDVAIFISTKQKPATRKETVAYIKILNGETEQPVYTLHSSTKKINIGRQKNVRVADGYFRQNQIAFNDESNNKSNKSVSRQHAHVEWNEEFAAFFLYADDGGIPPSNKIKVKPENGAEVRLLTTEFGHHLKEGDQIILGESALLEFSYKN